METLVGHDIGREHEQNKPYELAYLPEHAQAHSMRQDVEKYLELFDLNEDTVIDIKRDLTELFTNYVNYTPDLTVGDRILITLEKTADREISIDFGLNRPTPLWLDEQRQAYQQRIEAAGDNPDLLYTYDPETKRAGGYGTLLLDSTFDSVTQDTEGRIHLTVTL